MFSVDYQIRGELAENSAGRPTVPLTVVQKQGDGWRQHGISDLLLDTGATVTSLNKTVADENGYPIIKHGYPTVFGFNDYARALKALIDLGKEESEARAYMSSFKGRGKDLINSLRNDYGINDIGLVCDLRKVSFVVLYDFVVNDVLIATPSEDDVVITEVLGMNVLEKFHFGFDLKGHWLYLSRNESGISYVNSDFTCGSVSLLQE
ncbi:MAG: hypothetical protein FWE14_00495 [Lachnospiraceae bacterium]|nr:hypothetical protein [Lachnospiraceae bacterium]